jgi:hypothetical protein
MAAHPLLFGHVLQRPGLPQAAEKAIRFAEETRLM